MSRTADNAAVIKVARRLDREEAAEHLLTVKCFKKSARPQSLRKPYSRQVRLGLGLGTTRPTCWKMPANFPFNFNSKIFQSHTNFE